MTLAVSLAAAAHGSPAPAKAAADVLGVLSRRVPVAAAALTMFNPIAGEHVTLCSTGYDRRVLDYLRSSAFLERDIGYRLLVQDTSRRARCWRDISIGYAQTPSAVTVFRPAGYEGGATARLTTADGRYTGDLHLSTHAVDLPDSTAMTALHQAAPLLAAATDVTRRISLVLDGLEEPDDAADAAVVTGGGRLVELPGRAIPQPLLRGDMLVERVLAWRGKKPATAQAIFHHYARPQWWRLRLVPVSGGTLVETAATEPPYGLTPRELQVLTLLSEGLHNAAIGHRLRISERTAAHHVEHVAAKLGVSGRTAVARRVIEEGVRLLAV